MKIKDPAHAVRVLKFVAANRKDDVSPNVKMLIAGIEAVLRVNYPSLPQADHPARQFWEGRKREHGLFLMDLAQAYAPHMVESGMILPE